MDTLDKRHWFESCKRGKRAKTAIVSWIRIDGFSQRCPSEKVFYILFTTFLEKFLLLICLMEELTIETVCDFGDRWTCILWMKHPK